jgi:4-hydroxybenzoate polyprenyltransferase
MTDFRSWLVLGRVSNLSTVWSNALCAWILGGEGNHQALAWLVIGLSLLYIGGMYLNDFVDVSFDNKYRPERPIPAGKVKRSTVLIAAISMFALGMVCIVVSGQNAWLFGLLLLGLIVAYNWAHKHTVMGVPLMAACRMGIYLTVGAASSTGITPSIWGAGFLMFLYVLGITALARNESNSVQGSAFGSAFLICPLIGVIYLAGPPYIPGFAVFLLILTLWIARTFSSARASGQFIVGKTIGPLLAGICLMDLAILSSMHLVALPILGLLLAFFVIALIAQRRIPAT